MFKFIKEFFHLTHSEVKGVFGLIFLIVLSIVAPRLYFYFQKPKPIVDTDFLVWADNINFEDSVNSLKVENTFSAIQYFRFDPNTVTIDEMLSLGINKKTANILLKFRAKGAKFYSKEDLLKVYGFDETLYDSLSSYIDFPNNKSSKYDDKKVIATNEKFPFDPNTISIKDMKKLGISPKTAAILDKFRQKGAKFYTKEDILKVYDFSEELYAELEPFIIFPEREENAKQNKEEEKGIPTLYIVDINKADSVDFIKLKGIGPAYAKSIIDYRNKLGGFYELGQLKECWGIKPELFESLEVNLMLENPKFRTINLNTATFGDLVRHPYIDKDIANKILKLRKDIGGFLKIEDLKSYSALSEKDFQRLKNYLSI